MSVFQEREPPTKKVRVTGAGDWLDAELEMDDTELFGNQETAAYNLKSFSFEVRTPLYTISLKTQFCSRCATAC